MMYCMMCWKVALSKYFDSWLLTKYAVMLWMINILKSKGIGVIITDHNVRDTLPLSDYSYLLFEGKVLVEGTPSEIINNDKARKLYLGKSFSEK